MRVMLLHKSTPDTEAGKVPPASLIAAVGQMIGAMKEADVFRDGLGFGESRRTTPPRGIRRSGRCRGAGIEKSRRNLSSYCSCAAGGREEVA
jgi:hypothetical protein